MIRFFVAHPTIANLLMIGFFAAGLFTIGGIQRETFPRAEPSRVQVSVPYPGARAEDVESAICERLENAIDAVANVRELTCEAREGLGRAVARLVEGVDIDEFLSDVKSEVEAINDFPDKAEQPIIKTLGRTDFVASVAVSGIEDRSQLKMFAEQVRERMLRWGGIPKVDIKGFSTHQIRIELSVPVLRQFGLSVADIARTIQQQSIDLPGGSVESRDEHVLVRLADERKRPAEFLDLVVFSAATGGQIRLGDIATITDRFEKDEEFILFDGKPAAILNVTKTRNDDTLTVIDALKEFLVVESARIPKGVNIAITTDGASLVRDRLNLVAKNGLQGLVLVFLVMAVFFGLRYSFWVVMGLPVSFMGAFAIMSVMGYTLNLMTSIGLLIVVGILMDDAIVIAENIAAKREKGMPPAQAASEGALQVLPNVLSSFATTTLIFGSLAFLAGDLGAVLKVVPAVMLFVLVVSLIEAFLILPHHLSHSMQAEKAGRSKVNEFVERIVSWARENIVGKFVDLTIQWRYLTVGVSFGLLLLSVSMLTGGFLKFVAFPDLDGDTVVARILLPQGTPLAHTKAVVEKMQSALAEVDRELTPQQPDGKKLVRQVTVTFGENKDSFETGPHVATISADLLSGDFRSTRPSEILALWSEKTGDLPDIIDLKFDEATVGPAGVAIDLRLKGDDLTTLKKASSELVEWLRRYEGVTGVLDDLRPGKREMRIHLKEGAVTLGVNAALIADQLRAAYFGTKISELQVDGESFEVNVRLAVDDRNSLSDFDDFTIALPSGAQVPLLSVANLEVGRGYARINRQDGIRTVTVQGTIDGSIANANDIVLDTLARFVPKLVEKYPDIKVGVEGQNKEAQTTQKSMVKGFIIGLVGVFLILSFQFRSYIEPIVVMVVIPFALIGAIFGHMAMGLDFSMPSMLGFVALAGVVVNNSILLVSFIKVHHQEEGTVAKAAALASRKRFRAIFLTSLTTIAGLLPILTETSLQAQIMIPLVASLTFGLTASAVVVLFVVPAFYSILDDFGISTLSDAGASQGTRAIKA